MKIRIKGNSIRFRLTKTEVNNLAENGYLQEHTIFPNNLFTYALQANENATTLAATLDNNNICLTIPESFTKNWPNNNTVGIEASMQIAENKFLYLLVEKDFVCLDATNEDQSDHYENPNKQHKIE